MGERVATDTAEDGAAGAREPLEAAETFLGSGEEEETVAVSRGIRGNTFRGRGGGATGVVLSGDVNKRTGASATQTSRARERNGKEANLAGLSGKGSSH